MDLHHQINQHICSVTLTDTIGRNTIDESFCESLKDLVGSLRWDPRIRVWVFTSDTPQVFSTGRVKILEEENLSLHSLNTRMSSLCLSDLISHIPVPVIMGIDGKVSDHGLEFILSGDIRLASDISTFSIAATSENFPWDNGIPMLLQNVGRSVANDMLYTNRTLNAEESLNSGLVTRITHTQDFTSELDKLGNDLASLSPTSLKYIKEAVSTGMSIPLPNALSLEADMSVLLQSTADRAEGLKAFFQKRSPKFIGE